MHTAKQKKPSEKYDILKNASLCGDSKISEVTNSSVEGEMKGVQQDF